MAINAYNLGGGPTVGIYRAYQKPAKNKEEEIGRASCRERV